MNAVNRKLSIITINYNNLDGLKKTFESVVNQTWQEFEYIVIDGGSTDGSAAYLETQNDKFDYWVSEKDTGIYNAMNKGIKVATGEYLLFLNSGDHFYGLDVLEKNHNEIFGTDLICFNLGYIKDNIPKINNYPSKIKFSDFYHGSIGHPSTFIKRELFFNIGFYDENLRIVSDWSFFMKALFLENCSYKKVNNVLSVFELGGISEQVENFIEREEILKKYYSNFISDYDELFSSRKILNSNRIKMLLEIEKSKYGKKMISFFFKSYFFVFKKN